MRGVVVTGAVAGIARRWRGRGPAGLARAAAAAFTRPPSPVPAPASRAAACGRAAGPGWEVRGCHGSPWPAAARRRYRRCGASAGPSAPRNLPPQRCWAGPGCAATTRLGRREGGCQGAKEWGDVTQLCPAGSTCHAHETKSSSMVRYDAVLQLITHSGWWLAVMNT